MTLRLRAGDFEHFLRQRASDTPAIPAPEPEGLCLLPDRLYRENLREYFDREGIQTAPLAQLTTIETLASKLLAPTDEPEYILDGGIQDRLVEDMFLAADPSVDDPAQEELDPNGLLEEYERDAIVDLADRLPYAEQETRDAFRDELDDYFRLTDATADVEVAVTVLKEIDSRFAKRQTARAMAAFRGIERLTDARLSEFPTTRQQSQSHLVTAAREHVSTQWPVQFDHVEWIAVAGISVFDNPVLRFLATLAAEPASPDVHVFSDAGSLEYNVARFEALAIETEVPDRGETSYGSRFDSAAARSLFSATQGEVDDVPENVSFIEAPTDQRAVERVANDVRTLLQDSVRPREILIVAPDAGSYKPVAENAFETIEVPLYVQTRRPYANIPAYRCLRSFVENVEAVASETPLTYGELVDPLRLGYCPRGAHGSRWPIPGREFTKIEQELHRTQQFHNRGPDRYEDQPVPFEKWRDLIEGIPGWTADWAAVEEYLDDIESLADTAPNDGSELADLFGSYLGTYVFQTVDHRRALYRGPAIDTTRTAITERHPSSLAEQVRAGLDDVASHYDRVLELFGRSGSWEEVGRAFSTVLGSGAYGKSHLDRNAVALVDAGNADFREASHVFFLGMNADEFPAEPPTPTFLHSEFRQAVYEAASTGDYPYLHLDSRATRYGTSLDAYQTALSAAARGAKLSLFHTYRDERGNSVSWSPFVDLFDVEGERSETAPLVDRVAVGEWLPQPRDGGNAAGTAGSATESWEDVRARIAPRERLRTLLYHAHRGRPELAPAITEADVQTLVDGVDPTPLVDRILPRLERYQRPPLDVEIDVDEPAFDETSLSTVTGTPHQTHELDLNAQCGLKYYFYQFLYNYEGGEPSRDEIPKYYASAPHYRLGELPYLIRENYADPRYVEKWRRIVEELLPERQSSTNGLAQFDDDDELRTWVLEQDGFEEYDLNTIYENLRGERRLVEQELAADVTRDWVWRRGGEVTIEVHDLTVPAYRADIVTEGDSEYTIPVFFTRFTNRASSALKTCRTQPIWEADERTGTICIDCDRGDDCAFHSKYVVDHRMLAGQAHESDGLGRKVAGIGMQEQFAGPEDGARVVTIQNNYEQKFRPFDADGSFEQFAIRGYPQSWTEKVDQWKENFTSAAGSLGGETVTLSANERLVQTDECLDCVYRDLCMVPDSGVLRR
jgi:ATP-dependent helicase/nuclease subunit B